MASKTNKQIIFAKKSRGHLILTDNNIFILKKVIAHGEKLKKENINMLSMQKLSIGIDVPIRTLNEFLYRFDGHEHFIIKGEKNPFRKQVYYLDQFTLPKKTFRFPVFVMFIQENLA